MIKRIYTGCFLLISALVSGCSWETQDSDAIYAFPAPLQPLYIEPIDNFRDAMLRKIIEQQFAGYNVALTTNRQAAHTIMRLSQIQRATNKAVTNNVANNQSIFYKSQYNATISLSFPQHPKRPPLKLQVVTKTPVILLENQNIFSSSDTEQTFQELQNELSNQIARQVLFALQPIQPLSATTKKTI
jgi:outer membrane lipopolysaccharide assembly protein LptE/RlpB